MSQTTYTRVARRSHGSLGSSSLWSAPGHLILVEHLTGYEKYRRFFLEDVQAVMCWPSRRRGILRGVILGCAPLLYILTGSILDDWVMALLALLPFAALAVWNEVRGPGVTVTLATGVQRVPLKCVRRRSDWDRLVAVLQPYAQTTAVVETAAEPPAAQP